MILPYFAVSPVVIMLKRLYQKSCSFPSPVLFMYLCIWKNASSRGVSSFEDPIYLASTTIIGIPFIKRTISGIICFSFPGIRTLNWFIAVKILFSGFLKSIKWTVGLFSPVFLFSSITTPSSKSSVNS